MKFIVWKLDKGYRSKVFGDIFGVVGLSFI